MLLADCMLVLAWSSHQSVQASVPLFCLPQLSLSLELTGSLVCQAAAAQALLLQELSAFAPFFLKQQLLHPKTAATRILLPLQRAKFPHKLFIVPLIEQTLTVQVVAIWKAAKALKLTMPLCDCYAGDVIPTLNPQDGRLLAAVVIYVGMQLHSESMEANCENADDCMELFSPLHLADLKAEGNTNISYSLTTCLVFASLH